MGLPYINNQNSEIKKVKREMYEDVCFFGNFFGLVPDSYVKYFNLISLQIACTFVFTLFYYILLNNFDKHYHSPIGLRKSTFINHKLGHALFMAINFQTTTAYIELQCKSSMSRFIIGLQIFCAVSIAFVFLI